MFVHLLLFLGRSIYRRDLKERELTTVAYGGMLPKIPPKGVYNVHTCYTDNTDCQITNGTTYIAISELIMTLKPKYILTWSGQNHETPPTCTSIYAQCKRKKNMKEGRKRRYSSTILPTKGHFPRKKALPKTRFLSSSGEDISLI